MPLNVIFKQSKPQEGGSRMTKWSVTTSRIGKHQSESFALVANIFKKPFIQTCGAIKMKYSISFAPISFVIITGPRSEAAYHAISPSPNIP